VKIGDLVIVTGAIRGEGTTSYYVPKNFSTIAHPDIIAALKQAAESLGVRCHLGWIFTTDALFQETPELIQELNGQNVSSIDMVTSTFLTIAQLRKYHYAFGMEYFNEDNEFAKYGSHDEAVKAVEAGLAAGKQGVTKVYRVDVAGKKEVLFGVAMKGAGDSKIMDDAYIMNEIDFKDVKSAAHLPYDILVADNKVFAQYARFRIAVSFPDLSMMGANSFMNIMKSPEAIREALSLTVGGKKDAR